MRPMTKNTLRWLESQYGQEITGAEFAALVNHRTEVTHKTTSNGVTTTTYLTADGAHRVTRHAGLWETLYFARMVEG